MEERQRAHEHFFARIFERVDGRNLLRVHRQLIVAEHRPFGSPSSAASILQQRQILGRVERYERFGCASFPTRPIPVAEHIGPAAHLGAIGHVGNLAALEQFERRAFVPWEHSGERSDNQPLETRRFQHFRSRIVKFGYVERHQYARSAVTHLPGKFFNRVERRKIDDDSSCHHRAVIGRGVDRYIRQEQAHPVAFLDTHLLKPGSKPLSLCIHLAIGVGAAKEMQERRVRVVPNGTLEHFRQRYRIELRIPRGWMVVRGVIDIHVSSHGRTQTSVQPQEPR